MKELKINQLEYKRILGRNSYDDSKEELALFWGGAALEININARKCGPVYLPIMIIWRYGLQ